MQSENATLQDVLETRLKELNSSQNEIRSLTDRIEMLTEQLSEATIQAEVHQERNAVLEKLAFDLEQKVEHNLDRALNAEEYAKTKNEETPTVIPKSEVELEAAESLITELRLEIRSYEDRIKESQQREDVNQQLTKQLNSQLSECSSTIAALQSENQRIISEIEELEQRLSVRSDILSLIAIV